MKLVTFLIAALLTTYFFTGNVEAKVLPQAAKAQISGSVVKKSTTGGNIGVYPKLRGDRRALKVSFTNLQNASSVSYQLIYKTSTQDEGAMGGLNLNGSSSQNAELLFGTCSKNVCRYHSGIRDARLEVSYTLKSGKKYLKKYKIRV